MSESERTKAAQGAGTGAGGADPSMEDILASIRKILAEEEAPPSASPAAPPGVLQLDASMMVAEPPPQAQEEPVMAASEPPPMEPFPSHAPAAPPVMPAAPELVAPEAAAAAATSMGSLVRTLMVERNTQVHSGGPTLEEIVRSELRPLLKAWLDAHLPTLVERLVRVEIERVVGRAVP